MMRFVKSPDKSYYIKLMMGLYGYEAFEALDLLQCNCTMSHSPDSPFSIMGTSLVAVDKTGELWYNLYDVLELASPNKLKLLSKAFIQAIDQTVKRIKSRPDYESWKKARLGKFIEKLEKLKRHFTGEDTSWCMPPNPFQQALIEKCIDAFHDAEYTTTGYEERVKKLHENLLDAIGRKKNG